MPQEPAVLTPQLGEALVATNSRTSRLKIIHAGIEFETSYGLIMLTRCGYWERDYSFEDENLNNPRYQCDNCKRKA